MGVTTFPDAASPARASDFGRYVLNINSYRGTILPVGDDGSVEVPSHGFTFPFQGTNWSSVFVNGNGNLTFGAANADFSETVAELLAGPPRIAPLWDDLFSPAGLVIAEEKDHALQIHFVSVPEFLATGTNYFSVTLESAGTSRSTTAPPTGATLSSASRKEAARPIPDRPISRRPGGCGRPERSTSSSSDRLARMEESIFRSRRSCSGSPGSGRES